jgi:hypothetical protein
MRGITAVCAPNQLFNPICTEYDASSGFNSQVSSRLRETKMLTPEDKQWLDERLEQLETRMLTEFHQWLSLW